jgi:hypothetical protein
LTFQEPNAFISKLKRQPSLECGTTRNYIELYGTTDRAMINGDQIIICLQNAMLPGVGEEGFYLTFQILYPMPLP